MAKVKIARLQELIRRDVAQMLATGLLDPRLRFGSVVGVKLTNDLRYATVNVSCMGSEADRRTFMRALESARGRIQRTVAGHLRTRVTPTLRFAYDEGPERSMRVSKLIEQALAEDREAQRARGELPDDEPADQAPPATDEPDSTSQADDDAPKPGP